MAFIKKSWRNILKNPTVKEIKKIITTVKSYAEKYGTEIPVIVAGGIYNREDVQKVDNLGADGIQVATRFITTEECDADIRYKEAHLKAKRIRHCHCKKPCWNARSCHYEQIHDPCHERRTDSTQFLSWMSCKMQPQRNTLLYY